ncbi:Streptococcal hemagglutinin protein [Halorubrum sp. DM2]|uniref:hypothetical protein n=1 Tax=Halorubrum sp. DM2 TaxID=2527867 RepID=UPI0024B7D560|nr:hypothetical protein [Halorubrum sp. DM2]VTT86114.1 Streptococcal hemagglutinin protein [Halorubrum sp. DM2]
MPKNTDTNSDESDGEQSDEKTLATRAKLAVLALWAWVKPRAQSAVERVRDEFAQATNELAPQLRGALSGVSVPKRALKPLALVVVLLFAAVALGPAAPFASDSGPIDNGTEPVVGTTYEPVDDGEYRNVVTSRLGSLTSDAPPAPNEVRTSAGSQTMSVETTMRDGEPAIVLEDDRTHEGRWVAIETSWFDENVGEVPEAAYIEHENGSEYASPIETRGGEAAFYVQEFSTNTVTFSGEFTISATATDGDSFTYNATDGGDDLSINVTGVSNSGRRVVTSSSTSSTFDIGGNQPPQPPSGASNPVVRVNGALGDTTSVVETGDGSTSYTFDQPPAAVKNGTITIYSNYVSEVSATVSVKVDGTTVFSESTTLPAEDGERSFDYTLNNNETISSSLTYEVSSDNDAAYFRNTNGYDLIATGPAAADSVTVTRGSETATISNYDSATNNQTEIPLSDGQNTVEIDSTGVESIETIFIESTQTVDPVVEVNGETVSYTGTLADGEIVPLAANDSWIAEGQNTVNVSVGDGTLAAGSPAPQVALDYHHDVSKSRTIDYTGEAFSERYAVSESWNEDTANASLTIPWASDRVISLRSVTVEHRDANGNVVQTIDSPTYAFENGSVVVELGDVQAGWETTVSATGSKVKVENADLTVLKPTAQGNDLNSTVRLNNPGDDVYLRVGATEQGQQLHYLSNASWDTAEASRISADGTNEIHIPNAPDNGEAHLRTLPLAFDVNSGAVDVDVPDERVNTAEPVYRIGPGDRTGDQYSVTHVDAADGKPYVLFDESDDIVLDQGLASSPLTLSATEPEDPHVIQFRQDDGTATGSGDSGTIGSVAGGAAPMVTNSRPFSALSGLIPGPGVVVVGLAGLVGLAVLSRETSLFDEGTRSDAVADAAKDVGGRAGGLVERLLENEIVVAVLMLGAGAWLLSSGVFGPTERLIVALGSVPVAMYLALRQFGTFDFRVWAGSTAVVAVLGVVVLAPDVFETIADEAGVIIVAGVILLGWRALSAWRAEASTPDTVNQFEVETTDEGNNGGN